MPTFTKTEVVDARQFTGGVKNSKEIVAWINANEGFASVSVQTKIKHDGTKVVVETVEFLDLSEIVDGKLQLFPTSSGPGVWVVLKQDGKFKTMSASVFEAEYTQA